MGNLQMSSLKYFHPNWYVDKSPFINHLVFLGLINSKPKRKNVKNEEIKNTKKRIRILFLIIFFRVSNLLNLIPLNWIILYYPKIVYLIDSLNFDFLLSIKKPLTVSFVSWSNVFPNFSIFSIIVGGTVIIWQPNWLDCK